ncbi:hypothetical protein V6U90_30610 [Micromonospora sp. CPCC 206060]|uniref:hypothetical protein n=1 Tax=Micromonospora sp. CPCC 206060 TaxID=3122406 RepID=UPI002FEFAC83
MPGHRPASPGRTPARKRSDLDSIKAWWRTLGGDGFVVLPPQTRNRYTQTDGHEDAAELFAARGLGAGTSFAYWHWQSHQAFDRSGALTGELMLHWGGDHAIVAAGLGTGPAGYQVADGGQQGAFRLDRVTHRDGEGMPDPEDPAGVRQFLDRLDTPVDRSRLPYRYRPLTGIEAGWLHDRLRDPVDVSAAGRFVTSLEWRDALTYDEVSRLLPAWQEGYAGRLTEWDAWPALLHALLRHDHDHAWEAVAAVGPKAADILGQVPSERGLTVVRELALAGDGAAIAAWLTTHQAIREPDWVQAARTLAAELIGHDAPEASMRALFAALRRAVTAEWREDSGANYAAGRSFAALASVRFSTDERLPRELRVVAADAAQNQIAHVREEAVRLGPAYADLTDTSATDALAAADRYEAVRDELLAGTGPDLTLYEGGLCAVWHRYRTLTAADVRWLRAQVADEKTGMQGLAFCLELLYAHGAATEAEVAALLPRWKKDLTKQYRTTYTEWRHPLVTLTCLALDLDHPAAADLLAWWAKPRPVWKSTLRLLTHLGAPDEAKAAELWDFVTSSAHDTGHLMTWVLIRARLDQVSPLLVADRLLGDSGLRAYVLRRVLIGVADPAQPLWHYDVDPRSRDWWHRAQEVADHPELSTKARAIGLQAAREHHLLRYPDQVRPAPTAADLAAARAWIERHAGV